MPRFKMLGGRCDVEGKYYRYREGKTTIVETDLELDKMFKNQWERIDEKTKTPPDHRNTPNHSGTKVTDDLLAEKKRREREAEEEGAEIMDVSQRKPKKRQAARRVENDYERNELRDVEDEELPDADEDDTEDAEESRKAKKGDMAPESEDEPAEAEGIESEPEEDDSNEEDEEPKAKKVTAKKKMGKKKK